MKHFHMARWFTCSLFLLSITILIHSATAANAQSIDCQVCFYGPDNAVFDADNNAYITDSDHKSRFRIAKLSPSGALLGSWIVFSTIQGREGGPEGIAIDHESNIWVTDAGLQRVLELSSKGEVLSVIGSSSSPLPDLGHVAIAPDGGVYVAQGGINQIQKFSIHGELLSVWQRPVGARPEEWNRPESIACLPNGELALEDWANHRIVILSPSGQTLRIFGSAGKGQGQFLNSAGIAADRNGRIYIADSALHRVQIFDQNGVIKAIVANSDINPLFVTGPSSIAVDNSGILYASDGLSIVKFTEAGKILARWR